MKKSRRYPADCFRKIFTVDVPPDQISAARLYITACGLYEARLNGEKAGDFVLAPGITDYKKRIQYQTIDVGALLKSGANTLEITLADGWYRGSCGAWGLKNQYGTETAVLAQLEITDCAGRRQIIGSDESFSWSDDGPVRFADNKDGEIVDAGMRPSYAGKAKVTHRSVIPSASDNVPLSEHERLSASLITTPSGKTVLDFGQNIAGYIELSIDAQGRGNGRSTLRRNARKGRRTDAFQLPV